jgi:glycerol dehydrogenase
MPVRIFAAPCRYIQGAGALSRLGALVAGYGKRPFIVADGSTSEQQRQQVERLLRPSVERVTFGLCSEGRTAVELDRFIDSARALEGDVVIGLGGGVAIDIAKGVRSALDLPLVTVPTVPSCHSPISRVIELQADGNRPGDVRAMAAHAEVVLVDTAILVTTPPRQFIAGIGDAIARKFEVEQCVAVGALNLFDAQPTLLAAAAAEACYRALREHAAVALAAVVRRETGEAVERVAEALILLSGIAYESGGPSLAHALARGFATLPACRTALHGELVAFALLAQLVFEERPAALLDDLVRFYRSLGLPIRLGEIGLVGEVSAMVDEAARRSCREWLIPVDAKRLAEAITRVNALNLLDLK